MKRKFAMIALVIVIAVVCAAVFTACDDLLSKIGGNEPMKVEGKIFVFEDVKAEVPKELEEEVGSSEELEEVYRQNLVGYEIRFEDGYVYYGSTPVKYSQNGAEIVLEYAENEIPTGASITCSVDGDNVIYELTLVDRTNEDLKVTVTQIFAYDRDIESAGGDEGGEQPANALSGKAFSMESFEAADSYMGYEIDEEIMKAVAQQFKTYTIYFNNDVMAMMIGGSVVSACDYTFDGETLETENFKSTGMSGVGGGSSAAVSSIAYEEGKIVLVAELIKIIFGENDDVPTPDLSFVGKPGPLDGKTYVFDHINLNYGGVADVLEGSRYVFEDGKMIEKMPGAESSVYYQCKDGVIYDFTITVSIPDGGSSFYDQTTTTKMEVSADLKTLTLSSSVKIAGDYPYNITVEAYYTLQE